MACGGELRRPLFAYWMYIGVFWNSRRFCFGIRAATEDVVISAIDAYLAVRQEPNAVADAVQQSTVMADKQEGFLRQQLFRKQALSFRVKIGGGLIQHEEAAAEGHAAQPKPGQLAAGALRRVMQAAHAEGLAACGAVTAVAQAELRRVGWGAETLHLSRVGLAQPCQHLHQG